MPIQYSCFISYCHGDGDLIGNFINELVKALTNELSSYIDEGVYIDIQRLRPGYKWDVALTKALCGSVCMIVVYYPKYPRHTYCLQEYAGMELIEEERLKLLAQVEVSKEYGMIIPIVLRGNLEDIPQRIRDQRQFADFSKFSTANPEISTNPDYALKIKDIAYYIYQIYQNFEQLQDAGKDICDICNDFNMPDGAEIQPWPRQQKAPFPLR